MLKRGSIDFITNAVKLSEGFDFPPIQSVIIARPTRSPVLYKQMIGRGLRKHPGKQDCIVVEFTGSDPEMLKWEDIDENCQFHTFNEKQRMGETEARNKIANTFGDNVKVLDVRLSPFNFYECLLTRLVKYKNFHFMPGDKRFLIFRTTEADRAKRTCDQYFNVLVWHCVWNKEMEDYYIWNEGPIFYDPRGYDMMTIYPIMRRFIDLQKFGKWYPSECDKMSSRQMKLLPKSNLSARKAEFTIEDSYYKNLIEREWIIGKNSDFKKTISKVYDDR